MAFKVKTGVDWSHLCLEFSTSFTIYVNVKIHKYKYKSVCSICSTLYVLNSIKTDDVRISHLLIRS